MPPSWITVQFTLRCIANIVTQNSKKDILALCRNFRHHQYLQNSNNNYCRKHPHFLHLFFSAFAELIFLKTSWMIWLLSSLKNSCFAGFEPRLTALAIYRALPISHKTTPPNVVYLYKLLNLHPFVTFIYRINALAKAFMHTKISYKIRFKIN